MSVLTVEGNYKNGTVQLSEKPAAIQEARVLVTFLTSADVDLRARGIGEAQAADLRGRLKTMSDDWNRPEMDIYDAS